MFSWSELSKRYRLERVPDTLALQVIDRDMCDEVRTVHSLSGGESFWYRWFGSGTLVLCRPTGCGLSLCL